MTAERYLELKKSGVYTKESKMLIRLNDIYQKFIYLSTITDIEIEKKRLRKQLDK